MYLPLRNYRDATTETLLLTLLDDPPVVTPGLLGTRGSQVFPDWGWIRPMRGQGGGAWRSAEGKGVASTSK